MFNAISQLISSKQFRYFITLLILLNGVILGLATSKPIISQYSGLIDVLDKGIITIFTIEIMLRIYIHRLSFFKDPWSLFDFFVVAISLAPVGEHLSVLRTLRLFRLLTVIPQMRMIVSALLGAIPGILSISMTLILFFYVFAIMATELFSEQFPQWFGTLGDSMYTLFQIMTLESWSMGIARPVMEAYPLAWIFFVIYILIVTFIMVNLFIGIIVDAIFTIKEHENPKETEVDVIQKLRSEVAELKQLIVKMDKKI